MAENVGTRNELASRCLTAKRFSRFLISRWAIASVDHLLVIVYGLLYSNTATIFLFATYSIAARGIVLRAVPKAVSTTWATVH
jgi:hypothetical protein